MKFNWFHFFQSALLPLVSGPAPGVREPEPERPVEAIHPKGSDREGDVHADGHGEQPILHCGAGTTSLSLFCETRTY